MPIFYDGDIPYGPCPLCENERELDYSLTVTVTAHHPDGDKQESTQVDVCEACAMQAYREQAPAADEITFHYEQPE